MKHAETAAIDDIAAALYAESLRRMNVATCCRRRNALASGISGGLEWKNNTRLRWPRIGPQRPG